MAYRVNILTSQTAIDKQDGNKHKHCASIASIVSLAVVSFDDDENNDDNCVVLEADFLRFPLRWLFRFVSLRYCYVSLSVCRLFCQEV